MKIAKIAYSLIIFIGVVVILIYGKDFLLPFVLAIIIWFVIKEIRKLVSKIKFGDRSLPYWLLNTLSVLSIFGALFLITQVLTTNINQLGKEVPIYQKNVEKVIHSTSDRYGIDVISELKHLTESFELSSILNLIFDSVYRLIGNAFLVFIYVLFLLMEESTSLLKLKAIYPMASKFSNAKGLIDKINSTVSRYLFLKTVVSTITGVCSYIALLIIGVDFAFFWAFLIFSLNYIPTIGSLIATAFPTLIALLQFGELGPALAVLISVGAVQVLVGNFIEPRLVGNSLNISPLVVILSLSFWGFLWGVVGMLLCVPITVIMVIIFAQFDSTKPIAILLSGKGEVGD